MWTFCLSADAGTLSNDCLAKLLVDAYVTRGVATKADGPEQSLTKVL